MKIGPIVITTVGDMRFQAEVLTRLLGDEEKTIATLVLFVRLLTGETSLYRLAHLGAASEDPVGAVLSDAHREEQNNETERHSDTGDRPKSSL